MADEQYTDDEIASAQEYLKQQERQTLADQEMERQLKKNSLFDKFGLAGTPEDVRNPVAGIGQFAKSMINPIAGVVNTVRDPKFRQLVSALSQTPGGLILAPIIAKQKLDQIKQEDQMPSVDPYKLAGVKEDPAWTTKSGLEQKAGQYGPDAYAIGHLATRIPGLLASIPNAIREGVNLFRPHATEARLAQESTQEMQHGFLQAKNAQQDAYALPMNRYRTTPVTNRPRSYFHFSPAEEEAFGPEARRLRDAFYDEPNFENLHEFQSQLGTDISEAAEREPYRAQALARARQEAHDRIDDFFRSQNDAEAMYSYQHGRQLTRDVVEPYRTTAGTRSIVNRLGPQVNLGELEARLRTALEQGDTRLNRIGQIEREWGSVPQDHHLREMLQRVQDQRNIVNRRRLYKNILFGSAGALGTGALFKAGMKGANYAVD